MRWFALSFAVLVFSIASPYSPCHAAPRQQVSPSPQPVFVPKYLEQISLRYSDPVVVAKTLNARALPDGVFRVQPDPKTPRTLRVLGTQEGVATIRTLVSLIDVKPRQGIFRVTVERIQFSATGKKYTAIAARKVLTLTHNVPARFSLTDSMGGTVAVSITARLPQIEGTPATLVGQLGWREAKGASVGLERAIPLPTGTAVQRVMGLTFAENPDIIGTVGVGNIPSKWNGRFTAYYLALQPVSVSK
ncbi:MAG: hypothetical protein H8F28_20295 [Fibrella sp.]|nr:hypothetical protein [Armatimonadota bacterium]